MNVYWFAGDGKIEKGAFGLSDSDVASINAAEANIIVSDVFAWRVDDFYVHDGELIAKPARPSPEHTWDYASQAWIDARSLDEVKAQRWAQIKAQRDAIEFGGFTWDGDDFDSDVASQARIMGAVQMATLAAMVDQPFSIDWTLATNSVRTLDGGDMAAVGLTLGAHVAQQHETGRSLRAAIEACTTAGEVEAISWPA